jgi:hypothetical protein
MLMFNCGRIEIQNDESLQKLTCHGPPTVRHGPPTNTTLIDDSNPPLSGSCGSCNQLVHEISLPTWFCARKIGPPPQQQTLRHLLRPSWNIIPLPPPPRIATQIGIHLPFLQILRITRHLPFPPLGIHSERPFRNPSCNDPTHNGGLGDQSRGHRVAVASDYKHPTPFLHVLFFRRPVGIPSCITDYGNGAIARRDLESGDDRRANEWGKGIHCAGTVFGICDAVC